MRIIRRILVRIVVKNDIDRVEGRYIWVLPGEDVFSQGALQRGEPKNTFAVALQDELDHAVAESANAIVKDEGMAQLFLRFGFRVLSANLSIAVPTEQIGEVASQEAADSPERRVIEALELGRIGSCGITGVVLGSVGGKAGFVSFW